MKKFIGHLESKTYGYDCKAFWVSGKSESWCSGYGRRLAFKRLWVRILAPYSEWTFSHCFAGKIVIFI